MVQKLKKYKFHLLSFIIPIVVLGFIYIIRCQLRGSTFFISDSYVQYLPLFSYFKDVIDRALSGLSLLDRRIIKKKFGIGFPNELSNNEIAESEGLSLSDVKNSINKSLKYIEEEIPDAVKENIIELFS